MANFDEAPLDALQKAIRDLHGAESTFVEAVTITLEGGTFGVLQLPEKTFRVYRDADGAEVDILRV